MKAEILAAWERVYDSGRYVLGPELEAFEREFAEFTGMKHCVGVSSGTDALTLIFRAIGVEGKEVLVPAVTFIATAEAVILAGGAPVFTDIDPETWLMTPETAKPHITARTCAVVPVHLFGRRATRNWSSLRAHAPIIEDACQAAGRIKHHSGLAAAYSFYPSKQLAGCGDGGAIVTNDAWLASWMRRYRSHGSTDNRRHEWLGTTARLDELQAAALRVRLRNFKALPQINTPQQAYAMPCHLQPSMAPYRRGPLPVAESLFASEAAAA